MNCSDKMIFFRCGIELASLKNCLVVTMYSIVKEPNEMLHVCAEQKNYVSDEVSIALLASWMCSIYYVFFVEPVTIIIHGENLMAIFTTRSVVIWFPTGTLGIFATLVYAFTMRVVIYDILSMAIIPTLSTTILLCNLYYILLRISPRSVVKIAIRI